jgi:hypothetical protein
MLQGLTGTPGPGADGEGVQSPRGLQAASARSASSSGGLGRLPTLGLSWSGGSSSSGEGGLGVGPGRSSSGGTQGDGRMLPARSLPTLMEAESLAAHCSEGGHSSAQLEPGSSVEEGGGGEGQGQQGPGLVSEASGASAPPPGHGVLEDSELSTPFAHQTPLAGAGSGAVGGGPSRSFSGAGSAGAASGLMHLNSLPHPAAMRSFVVPARRRWRASLQGASSQSYCIPNSRG